jgi:hypothetical protein
VTRGPLSAAGRRRLAAAAGLLLAVPLLACGDRDEELRRAAEESRFRRETLSDLGAPLAGISARRQVHVAPLNPRRLAGDTIGYAFDRYHHRCSACHAVPDPRLHTPARWRGVIDRMNNHARSAGLLPISGLERDSIQGFLDRHSRPR